MEVPDTILVLKNLNELQMPFLGELSLKARGAGDLSSSKCGPSCRTNQPASSTTGSRS